MKLNVTDSELVALLNKASLMLCTSRLEPFGFGVLEANACGLPVVAVKEGGFRETVQDGLNGFLVDADAKSIASAATRILENCWSSLQPHASDRRLALYTVMEQRNRSSPTDSSRRPSESLSVPRTLAELPSSIAAKGSFDVFVENHAVLVLLPFGGGLVNAGRR